MRFQTPLLFRENVCIFAETKEEWLVCALGCFKQTFPLVTLYANLGDDAIAHGINQVGGNRIQKCRKCKLTIDTLIRRR